MPPEFRSRIDEDLDQALEAFMDKKGYKRAHAGRELMRLGLASVGIEPGEKLSMENALEHLDRAMTVFTVPLQQKAPSMHSDIAYIPEGPLGEDGAPRIVELVSRIRPVSGFILLSIYYEPVVVRSKVTLERLNVLGQRSLLPYDGEHDLENWSGCALPSTNLEGTPIDDHNDRNQPRLSRLSIVRPGCPVEARVRVYGHQSSSFRLHLVCAPLSHWRSYARGLAHEARQIEEQRRIFDFARSRKFSDSGSTVIPR